MSLYCQGSLHLQDTDAPDSRVEELENHRAVPRFVCERSSLWLRRRVCPKSTTRRWQT